MKIGMVLTLSVLLGICGAAIGDDGGAATQPSDNMAAATTRPDVQALREKAMDCQVALDRARADCVRRLEQDEQYKSATADLELAKTELTGATDSDSRAKGAMDRMAAKKHLDDLKAEALASDQTVMAAATAQKRAAEAYQAAMLQDAAAATMSQAKANLQPAEEDDAVKEMMQRGEVQRLADIKSLLDEIRKIDAELSAIPEDAGHEGRRVEISQEIVKDRQTIAQCESLKGHYLPILEMEVGSTGAIFGTLHVFQIIDGKNVIVRFGEDSLCWVKGFDTAGLVDDQKIEFQRALRVSGTTQYTTTGGSTKTVFLLEPFGPLDP